MLIIMSMTSKHNALEEQTSKLAAMSMEMEALQTRIAKQQRIVGALASLAGLTNMAEDDLEPNGLLVFGITDACRSVLRAADKPLFPIHVRERVVALGVRPHPSLLASVYTVLRRLTDSGEARGVRDPDHTGTTVLAYEWVRPSVADLRNLYASGMRGNETPRMDGQKNSKRPRLERGALRKGK
jgi:hypothetical protein